MGAIDPSWIPWLAAGAVGGAAAALGWVAASLAAEVPAEDRTYRDRPPPGFRLVWWPVHWLAHYLDPLLPRAWVRPLQARLRQAGLDYALSPAQLLAAQALAALAAAGLAVFVLDAWGLPDTGAVVSAAAAFGALFPAIWLRDRVLARRRDVLKTLPFMLDIITLCVEAGLNLTGAFQQATAKGPAGPLRDELARVMRDVRAGKPRSDALRTFADRLDEPAIVSLVSGLIQAEALGMSLGPILRAQAEQRRTERFARAEKLAMEAPVKLLFPLIAFIFPCTFLVLGFPIVMKFLRMGL
jgi:tight adherence protein C